MTLLFAVLFLPLSGCASSEAASLGVVPHDPSTVGQSGILIQATARPGSSSPLALPPTIDAHSWAILSDATAGLTFAYPTEWSKVGAITQQGGVTFANYNSDSYPGTYLVPPLVSVTVSVRNNPKNLSPGDYYNTEISANGADAEGPTTTNTTTLAGQYALVVTAIGIPGEVSPSVSYYLADGSLPRVVIVRIEDPAADTAGVSARMLASLIVPN